MKLDLKISDLYRQLSLCNRCKICTYGDWPNNSPLCPPYLKHHFFSHSGGGMIYLARALLQDIIGFSPSVADIVYKCTTCGACEEICPIIPVLPPHISPLDVVRMLRAELVKRDLGPINEQKKQYKSIEMEHNPYGLPHEDRLKQTGKNVQSSGEIMLFVGCTAAYKSPEIVRAAAKVLDAADIQFSLMPDEWCCGAVLFDTGQWNLLPRLAKHNVEAIRSFGAKTVVFLCPHCYEIYDHVYPEILDMKNLGFETIHITKYVDDLIRHKKVKIDKEVNRKVTYHDPCHLGRGMNNYDAPRNIIGNIPGAEMVEMKRNQEYSFCCGFGGGVGIGYPNWSLEICKERFKEAEETAADILITACPSCKLQFMKTQSSPKSRIRVQDITEIIASVI